MFQSGWNAKTQSEARFFYLSGSAGDSRLRFTPRITVLTQCGPVTERCYRVRTVYILGPLHLGACPEPIAPWIQIWLQNLLLVISCLQLVIYTSITPPFHGGNTGSNPLGSLSALRRANQLQQRIHSLSQSASIK